MPTCEPSAFRTESVLVYSDPDNAALSIHPWEAPSHSLSAPQDKAPTEASVRGAQGKARTGSQTRRNLVVQALDVHCMEYDLLRHEKEYDGLTARITEVNKGCEESRHIKSSLVAVPDFLIKIMKNGTRDSTLEK